jgi:hypothetical protein
LLNIIGMANSNIRLCAARSRKFARVILLAIKNLTVVKMHA